MYPQTIGRTTTQPNPQKVRIIDLMMREVPVFHTAVHRSYTPQITGEGENTLINRINNNNNVMNKSLIAGITDKLLGISTLHRGDVAIYNGWGTKRFSFIMVVEIPSSLGSIIEVISGFTDHDGAMNSNGNVLLDDNMIFVANECSRVRDMEVTVNNNGIQTKVPQRAVGASQYVVSQINFGSTQNDLFVQTPRQTVLTNQASTYFDNNQFMITSNTISNNPVATSVTTASPMNYAATLIDSAVRNASMLRDNFGGMSTEELYNSIGSELNTNSTFGETGFMSILSGLKSSYRNHFTWKDLKTMDPHVEQIVKLFYDRTSVDFRSNTEQLGGANIETIKASWISYTLPGILMGLGLRSAKLHAHNKTLTGEDEVTISDAFNYGGSPILPNTLHRLIHDIKINLLTDLSSMGMINYEFYVDCDCLGTTRIDISIEGRETVPFAFPSFCDSLWMPFITPNQEDLTDMARGVSQIIDSVTSGTTDGAVSTTASTLPALLNTMPNPNTPSMPTNPIPSNTGMAVPGVNNFNAPGVF